MSPPDRCAPCTPDDPSERLCPGADTVVGWMQVAKGNGMNRTMRKATRRAARAIGVATVVTSLAGLTSGSALAAPPAPIVGTFFAYATGIGAQPGVDFGGHAIFGYTGGVGNPCVNQPEGLDVLGGHVRDYVDAVANALPPPAGSVDPSTLGTLNADIAAIAVQYPAVRIVTPFSEITDPSVWDTLAPPTQQQIVADLRVWPVGVPVLATSPIQSFLNPVTGLPRPGIQLLTVGADAGGTPLVDCNEESIPQSFKYAVKDKGSTRTIKIEVDATLDTGTNVLNGSSATFLVTGTTNTADVTVKPKSGATFSIAADPAGVLVTLTANASHNNGKTKLDTANCDTQAPAATSDYTHAGTTPVGGPIFMCDIPTIPLTKVIKGPAASIAVTAAGGPTSVGLQYVDSHLQLQSWDQTGGGCNSVPGNSQLPGPYEKCKGGWSWYAFALEVRQGAPAAESDTDGLGLYSNRAPFTIV
jgi:hypothetical protein